MGTVAILLGLALFEAALAAQPPKPPVHCLLQGIHSLEAQLPTGSPGTRVPPPIPKYLTLKSVPEKVLDPARLKGAAIVLDPAHLKQGHAPLAHLADGQYVFGVDTEGRRLILPKALPVDPRRPVRPGETYVGSHDGLRILSQALGGPETAFVSTGEFYIRDGRAFALSNGSGTWRGGPEHLAYGEKALVEAGLPVDPHTLRLDYSTGRYPDPHGGTAEQTALTIQYAQDPELKALLERTRKAMRRVNAHLPAVMRRLEALDPTQMMEIGLFIKYWNSGYEAEAWAVNHYLKIAGIAHAKQVLGLLPPMKPSLAYDLAVLEAGKEAYPKFLASLEGMASHPD